MAYMVACQTGEIGVRMALGADQLNIVRLVLRGAFLLVAIGLLIGIPLAIGAGRLMAAQLFEIRGLGSECVWVFNSCARGLRRGRQYSTGASSRFDGSTEGAAH
jgi:ABC-type antimicrobial peptide transport system permease subunit